MKKVLICAFRYDTDCLAGKRILEDNGFTIVQNPNSVPYTKPQLLKLVRDVDAVISGNEVWDRQLYQAAPKLKIIARFGIGVDNIDLDGARERGIFVCNAPSSTNSVAELVCGYIIVLLRHLVIGNQWCKAGRWDRFFGHEVRGKKIGFLGYGRIPKLISKKLMNFEAEMYAFDQCPDLEYAKTHHVTMVSKEKILQECDIVSLHLPSNPSTYRFMDAAAFAQMKRGAYFLNTGRGALVDEDALYNALISGHLAGAACDVFAQEPVSADNKLLGLETFICTPHWGSDTYETVQAVGELTAKQVVQVLCGGQKPDHCLNA